MKAQIESLPTPSTYSRILLQRWPQQAAILLDGTGLDTATLQRASTISAAQQLRLLHNAMNLAGRVDWALDFGRQLNVNSHGPLGFAALSAPTLGEGLDVLSRFARIRVPYMGFQREQCGDRVLLRIDTDLLPLGGLALPLIEIALQVAASYVEAVLGHPVAEARFLLKAPPPPHAALYAAYFPSPWEFNAAATAFSLPASLCPLPCPLYDEKSYRGSLIRCREALDGHLGMDDMATRVAHLLASHFDQIGASGDAVLQPRLDDFASLLCVSPRSLIRQLAAQGSSFRALLDAQRLEVAGKLLTQARYSVSDIGALLGYGDAANFSRAFRRLTGLSPGQYRRTSGQG